MTQRVMAAADGATAAAAAAAAAGASGAADLSCTLLPWDPSTHLRDHGTVLIIGATGSGKTELVLDILESKQRKLDMMVAFVPTSDTADKMKEHITPNTVHDKFDAGKFKEVIRAQRQVKVVVADKNRRAAETGQPLLTLRTVGLLLDDCMFEKKVMKLEELRYVFMNGRHDNLFFVATAQYLMDIPPEIRSQVGTAIVFPNMMPGMLTRLRENLLGCFQTDEELLDVFTNHIKAYEALIYDRIAHQRGQPYLFFYKAKCPPPGTRKFLLGLPALWEEYYRTFNRSNSRQAAAQILSVVGAKDGGDGGEHQDGDRRGGSAAGGGAGGGRPAATSSKYIRINPRTTAAGMVRKAAKLPSDYALTLPPPV